MQNIGDVVTKYEMLCELKLLKKENTELKAQLEISGSPLKAGTCEHKNTIIWEPHLAGARKCKDCGMVYNPNMSVINEPVWFFEVPEFNWKQEATRLESENARITELVDNMNRVFNEMALKNAELKAALKDLENIMHYDISDATNAIFARVEKLK